MMNKNIVKSCKFCKHWKSNTGFEGYCMIRGIVTEYYESCDRFEVKE